MELETTTMERSCKDSVMHRIEGEQICPRPKSFYTRQEMTVWMLWAASIVIGALAIAVMLFTFMYHHYSLYEATHENFTTFLMDALPYLWILMFTLMAGVAVYNLRHTKHGYRYPLWQIFTSSFVLSLAGGALLHAGGFGYAVDHALGAQMPQYVSQEKFESKLWQNPKEGRLVGQVTKQIRPPATMAIFTDVEGLQWKLDTSELSKEEEQLVFSEKRVKMIGIVHPDNVFFFHVCGAFPWLLDKEASRADYQAVRTSFEIKMRGLEGRDLLPPLRKGSTTEGKDSLCKNFERMKRD